MITKITTKAQYDAAKKAFEDAKAQAKAAGILTRKGKTEDNVKVVFPILRAGKTVKDAASALLAARTKNGAKYSKQQAQHVASIVSCTLALVNAK